MTTKSIIKKTLFVIICFSITIISKGQNPTLAWAKGIGSAAFDDGQSVVVDGLGNVYTTGDFLGTTDFDPGAGTFNMTPYGQYDVFVTKFDASGNFVWAKQLGGSQEDKGYSIAIDASNNIYVAGQFYGTADFDPGIGSYTLTSAGMHDIFVTKIDAAGNPLWAKQLGGNDDDMVSDIALDPSGNIYLTGYFKGTANFNTGPGTYTLTSLALEDAFVAKLNNNGSFSWAKQFGGAYTQKGKSIAVDAAGNTHIIGEFNDMVDFDPGAGTFNLTAQGLSSDIFISKLNTSGNFVWAKQLSGPSFDYGNGIALDASGNVYTTGSFKDAADFDPSSLTYFLTSPNGYSNVFISKLSSTGNYIWARQIGGSSNSTGASLVVNTSNVVYVAGYFSGATDFDPGTGTYTLNALVGIDAFVAKLNNFGNFVWAKQFGGGSSSISDIDIDASDNIYTVGGFDGTVDFDPNAGVFNLVSAGNGDVFVHKMSQPTTGINENYATTSINIYPNPSTGNFIIQSITNGSYEIVDMLGKKILFGDFKEGQNNINISNQNSGLYFLKVESETEHKIIKLLKE